VWDLGAERKRRGATPLVLAETSDCGVSGARHQMMGTADLTGAINDEVVQVPFKASKHGSVIFNGQRKGTAVAGACTYKAAGTGTFKFRRL